MRLKEFLPTQKQTATGGGINKVVGTIPTKPGQTTGQTTQTNPTQNATGQPTNQKMPNQLAPGQAQPMPVKIGTMIPVPGPMKKLKVNKIDPKFISLDTEKQLGMNLKVDPAELSNYMQNLQGQQQK